MHNVPHPSSCEMACSVSMAPTNKHLFVYMSKASAGRGTSPSQYLITWDHSTDAIFKPMPVLTTHLQEAAQISQVWGPILITIDPMLQPVPIEFDLYKMRNFFTRV